jgi:tRNA1(Val) A37 N6-methylase TrmN6
VSGTGAALAEPAFTADRFLGGRVLLLQPRSGHRAGLDAALLQALVPAGASGAAADLGAGAGAVAFSLAARVRALTVTAVERNAELVALARLALERPENAAFSGRMQIAAGDVAAAGFPESAGLAAESFDWVLMNPPFDVAGRVRASPDVERRAAHVAEPGTLAAWTRAAAMLLRRGGRLGLIHRASVLDAALSALQPRFGAIRVTPVHPAADRPAGRILLQAARGSRAPVAILPGLVLHEGDGRWTGRAEAILRGTADLAA